MSGLYLPECRTCRRTKKPIGRDAPLSSNCCGQECEGYRADPFPPSFWSREEELETRLERAEWERDAIAALREADAVTWQQQIKKLEEWKRSGMQVIREVHEALAEHGQLGESSADCIRRLAARVKKLEAAAAGSNYVLALIKRLEKLESVAKAAHTHTEAHDDIDHMATLADLIYALARLEAP